MQEDCNTWSPLSVEEKVRLLAHAEYDPTKNLELWHFGCRAMVLLRRCWPSTIYQGEKTSGYYKLRVSSTWFTVLSSLQELDHSKHDQKMNLIYFIYGLLFEHVFLEPWTVKLEKEKNELESDSSLYGLPVLPSYQQSLCSKCEQVSLLFITASVY